MGERKPSSYYIPYDFDPDKVQRRSKPRNGQHQVRFMLPMSIKCKNCGEFMFRGTKLNGRKELCYDEFYLDIKVYRFYLHCKNCYAEITVKTDPKNSDYIVEEGATRSYEPYKEAEQLRIEEIKDRIKGKTEERKPDQSYDSKREIDELRELEELKSKASNVPKITETAEKNSTNAKTPTTLKKFGVVATSLFSAVPRE